MDRVCPYCESRDLEADAEGTGRVVVYACLMNARAIFIVTDIVSTGLERADRQTDRQTRQDKTRQAGRQTDRSYVIYAH